MSRENTTQANSHQKEGEKPTLGHGKGGTVVPYGTGWPCLFAGYKNRVVKKSALLGPLKSSTVLDDFGEWEMIKMEV